jgi:hypothetical protein
MGWGDFILAVYGVQEFIADIDASRQYWREPNGDSIIGAYLTWLAEEGFGDFMAQYDQQYATAHEFRQRYMLRAISRIGS